jgi:hypothetical protein
MSRDTQSLVTSYFLFAARFIFAITVAVGSGVKST